MLGFKNVRIIIMRVTFFITLFCFGYLSLLIADNKNVKNNPIIEDVSFINQGDTLSGTLVLPDTSSLCPALIMIHGSGKSERNIEYAKKLASKGVATLTYDKRGVGKSGGKYEGNLNASTNNLSLLADDAIAGINILMNHKRIDKNKIGVWGISQAGWIAPIAASKSKNISYMVILSGPTVPVIKELKYSKFSENDPEFFNKYSQEEIEELMNKWSFSDIFFKTIGFNFDPKPYLETLEIPVLWIYGDKDRSIPAHLSMKIIDQNNKGNFKIKCYPNYDHSLNFPDDQDIPAAEVNDYFINWIMNLTTK
jgi:dienelactone hydrolase